MQSPRQTQLVSLLLMRLERVSVNFVLGAPRQRRAGGLLRALEKVEVGQSVDELRVEAFDRSRIRILERAAQERTK